MMQGALDYALNLAGEVWSMVWRPKGGPTVQTSDNGTRKKATPETREPTAAAVKIENKP